MRIYGFKELFRLHIGSYQHKTEKITSAEVLTRKLDREPCPDISGNSPSEVENLAGHFKVEFLDLSKDRNNHFLSFPIVLDVFFFPILFGDTISSVNLDWIC